MHDEKTLIFQKHSSKALGSKRALTLTLADMPSLKVVDGSDQRRDVLTPMHDEKTLIFQNIRRLRRWRWRLVQSWSRGWRGLLPCYPKPGCGDCEEARALRRGGPSRRWLLSSRRRMNATPGAVIVRRLREQGSRHAPTAVAS